MVTVCSSEFVMGARQVGALPSHDLHEIAILGRSNVGKSTFLNKIAGRRKLARTSSKPGHTQELNLYKIELAVEAQKKSVYLLDLPGFGYAKLAKKQRNQIADMILDYIEHRQELRLVCLLNDCRRSPQAEELIVRDIAFERDLRL
ncbi:MAG: ribosome biogenesis GTP-binding protein YsxC, partial [Bdellovibrionales bacterium]|nr:ribosome biogenesis GTP-binding protein YsxC [Bdellovibrionales bacterium]